MDKPSKRDVRNTILPLKCNTEDFNRIDYLCKVYNLSRSDVLRLSIDILYNSMQKLNIDPLEEQKK